MNSEATQDATPAHQEIVLIAALAESNRVIGNELELPWHISEDLRRFKGLTLGKPLVMGRTTYNAIIRQFGAPLKNRRTVVLSTRGAVDELEGVETYRSIPDLLHALRECPLLYIGGGGKIYQQFLPLATRMELTLVRGTYDGDTFFPPYETLVGSEFAVVSVDPRDGYRFVTYQRIASHSASTD